MQPFASPEAARAELTRWGQIYNQRNPLLIAAARTGISIAEAHRLTGLARNTIRGILDAAGIKAADEDTPKPAEPTDFDIPHHPHYISVTGEGQRRVWKFREFTGLEPEPVLPEVDFADWDNHPVLYSERSAEYYAANDLWRTARYRTNLRTLIGKAVPVWNAFAAARLTVDQLFQELVNSADGQWRAKLNRLLNAQQDALDAASAWDEEGYELAKAQWSGGEWMFDATGGVAGVAREMGLTSKDWIIGGEDEYHQSYQDGPARCSVMRACTANRDRIKEIFSITGDTPPPGT